MKWWEYCMLFAIVTLNIGTLGVYMKICEDTQKIVTEYEKRLNEFEEGFIKFEKKHQNDLTHVEEELDVAIKHCDMVLDSVTKKRW